MLKNLTASCCSPNVQLNRRDAWLGAGVILFASLLFSLLGIAARRNGFELTSAALMAVAFPGSVVLAMPFMYLKGKPWRAQLVMVALPLALVVLIAVLAHVLAELV